MRTLNFSSLSRARLCSLVQRKINKNQPAPNKNVGYCYIPANRCQISKQCSRWAYKKWTPVTYSYWGIQLKSIWNLAFPLATYSGTELQAVSHYQIPHQQLVSFYAFGKDFSRRWEIVTITWRPKKIAQISDLKNSLFWSRHRIRQRFCVNPQSRDWPQNESAISLPPEHWLSN